jgi:hypothetical protein
MRWKIVLEGTDEFGSAHRSELTIDKNLERLSAGEIGFSVEMARPSWLITASSRKLWRVRV